MRQRAGASELGQEEPNGWKHRQTDKMHLNVSTTHTRTRTRSQSKYGEIFSGGNGVNAFEYNLWFIVTVAEICVSVMLCCIELWWLDYGYEGKKTVRFYIRCICKELRYVFVHRRRCLCARTHRKQYTHRFHNCYIMPGMYIWTDEREKENRHQKAPASNGKKNGNDKNDEAFLRALNWSQCKHNDICINMGIIQSLLNKMSW